MAENKEKTAAENTEVKKEKHAEAKKAPAPKKKKENIFKRMGAAIKKFFKDFKGECKKITWPSGKTVLNNSLVVIAVVIVVGLVIFGIDQGLAAIIKAILGLAPDASDVAESTTQMIRMLFFR